MGDADDIRKLITSGTKKWTKQKKAEERNRGARRMRSFRMRLQKELSLKDAAAAVMEKAYMKASANGTLPANARQVMYAARGEIQVMTGKPLDDQYFTQTLLPNYIKENRLSWDIVFDDRGHFIEPHTNLSFGLGTINVRNYLAAISGQPTPQFIGATIADAVIATLGPPGSFGALLFIEKEGFDSLLKTTKLAQRYDIATMSSKGMSVTAAPARRGHLGEIRRDVANSPRLRQCRHDYQAYAPHRHATVHLHETVRGDRPRFAS